MPKDGLKVPLPEMRPVLASTEMSASVREPERSAKSAKIKGLYGVFPSAGSLVGVPSVGNEKRYNAVWLVTVISALTEVLS